MKPVVNQRKGVKYAECREWAYDLIANSTGTTASEMADMMAEQFGHPKSTMSHTLLSLVTNGSLKVVGQTTRNGKRTLVLGAVRRARPAHDIPHLDPEPLAPIPTTAPPAPATNSVGVYVVVETDSGPVKVTIDQARTIMEALGRAFK